MRFSILSFLIFLSSAGAWAQEYVEGEVLVKLKGKATSIKTQNFSSKLANEKGLEKQKSWNSMNLHHFKGSQGKSTEELMQELKADPEVEYVEPNYIVKKSSSNEGAQGFSYSQVQSFVTGFGLTSAPIQGVEAWGQIASSNSPIVAVIDTGADLTHPALDDAIWVNTDEIAGNGIDDDGNGYVDDRNGWNFYDNNNYTQDCDGHGTHVSGIIRGTTQFIFDPQNLDPAIVRIMVVKFLDCYGNGTTAGAINAIYYAVQNGAKVLNNSWGGGGYSRALHEAILYSYNARTLFVAAAGNSSNNNDSSKTYPASYDVPNVVSVAATTSGDNLASFSNYGASLVHVAAPGYNILSTYLNYGGCPPTEGCFTWLSGTSMAAPFVSGIAALMVNEKPNFNGYQIKKILQQNVDIKSQLYGKTATSGRVNSLNTLMAAKATAVDPFQPAYEIGISPEDRALASDLAMGGAGGCGMVRALNARDGSGRTPPYGTLFVISVLLMIPVLLAQALRRRSPRRAHVRYNIQAIVTMKIDGQEVTAKLSTISEGGAGLQTALALEKGQIVAMKIQAPDGSQMEVEGRVVWSSQKKAYGIQFLSDTSQSVLQRIRGWTRDLVPQA